MKGPFYPEGGIGLEALSELFFVEATYLEFIFLA